MRKEKAIKMRILSFFILMFLTILNIFPSLSLPGLSSIIHAQDSTSQELVSTTQTTRSESQWNHQVMNIDEAWTDGYTGAGITIAILDTGFFHRHPDITMAGGYSVFPDDAWSNDHSGHGTHIAGIIGAHQGTTYQGIAPGADLFGIKIYHEDDVDENGYVSTDVDSVIKGIRQAINIEADIIVISSGLTFHDQNLYDIILEAYRAGILIVAASGNGEESVNYPASYPEVIAVTSIDESLHPAFDIIYGKENEFAAPGVNIGGLSIPDSTYSYPYIFMSGSSQATPHVAGLAAIIMQKYNVRGQDARNIMQKQALNIGIPNLYGYGLIQYVPETELVDAEDTENEDEITDPSNEESVQTTESSEETTARKPSSSREADVDETENPEMTSHYLTDALDGDNQATLAYDVLPLIESKGTLEVELGDFNSLYLARDQVSELRERNIRIKLTKKSISWTIPPGNFIPGDATLRFYEGVPVGVEQQTGATTPIFTTAIFQTGARQNAHPSLMKITFKIDESPSVEQQDVYGYRWDREDSSWQKIDTEIEDDTIVLSTRNTGSISVFNPNNMQKKNANQSEAIVNASDDDSSFDIKSMLQTNLIGAVILLIALLLTVKILLSRKNRN